MVQINIIFLWLMIYSFIGWAYESTLCSITGKKLVNRGFLNGPVCPVYGFGALIIIFCLENIADKNILSLFLSSVVLTCTLEYITSWILEILFHTRWWDYSRYRFQLNGRVCLLGAIVFGLLSVLLLKYIHPFISNFVNKLPVFWLIVLSDTLFLILMIDLFITVKSILSMNHRLAELQQAINNHYHKLKDHLQEHTEDLKENLQEYRQKIGGHLEQNAAKIEQLSTQLKFNERRLLQAFPKMKSIKHKDALEQIQKKWLNRKHKS